jgi:hypothetical protein
MPVSISGTNGVTFPDSSLQTAAASPYVLKNRIINGAMVIDQRNAGASVTPADVQYTLDRWKSAVSAASKFTIQQVSTAPTGFNNSLKITSLSAYSIISTSYFGTAQSIEGYNVADLGFGTANAKTITISFWVRSSLTGTFGGCIRNENADRGYPFTYTILVADTWEQKTVTIAGDTTGTWNTTNGVGLQVCFSIGTGSSYSATAGAWTSTAYLFSATGATSLVGTNGATLYITGVQLEQNTSATPFERRLYNQELANCQRYYWRVVSGAGQQYIGTANIWNTVQAQSVINFPVTMRAAPSLDVANSAGYFSVDVNGTTKTCATWTIYTPSTSTCLIYNGSFTGLTGGQAGTIYINNSNAYLAFTAEL